MVSDSWFLSFLKPRRHDSDRESVGVLAFEVASLMSKLVHLWQSLSDKQISKLTDEIRNSPGIRKLVSEDEDFIARLICSEIIDNMVHVAKAVSRLSKRCTDSNLKTIEDRFEKLMRIGIDPYDWSFSARKMEKKVKKMERFISINGTLYQEMELLADLEQMVKRMKANTPEPDNLHDYQKKLGWKRQEVKSLREISLWNKSFNYAVTLLGRSLFTIFNRINDVFGIHISDYSAEERAAGPMYRGQSVSMLLRSPTAPIEDGSFLKFASGPLNFLKAKPELSSIPSKSNSNFFSGPLSERTTAVTFFSGPLAKQTGKKAPTSGLSKGSKKIWQIPQSPLLWRKKTHSKQNRLTQVGPLKGGLSSYNSNLNSETDPSEDGQNITGGSGLGTNSDFKLLKALPDTLGAAALALHYANVIIVIEKLAASPHLIGHDARDDLYNMLPANVRTALRSRLLPYTKTLASALYDTALGHEWREAMTSILEWLAPLAHNMIKWQSERSFEQHSFLSRTNVQLVQTLFFANQAKTEAVITELLVGLNYVWRFGRELKAKAALRECNSTRTFDEYLELDK